MQRGLLALEKKVLLFSKGSMDEGASRMTPRPASAAGNSGRAVKDGRLRQDVSVYTKWIYRHRIASTLGGSFHDVL